MSDVLDLLKRWSHSGTIRELDYHFARFLLQMGGDATPAPTLLLGALLSHQLGQGHICLPMVQLDRVLSELRFDARREARQQLQGDLSSALAFEQLIGDGTHPTPMVMEAGRLYLYRYWQMESRIAQQLKLRSHTVACDQSLLAAGLERLFPTSAETDWQRVAAAVALGSRFSVISGGPGTGKTTTVIRLLALYIEQQLQLGKEPTIRLAAPTGKAAARMAESIASAREDLDADKKVKDLVPERATTLHRLLGPVRGSYKFRHNESNPLHLDLLIVDEASMVDLTMMTALMDALPEHARLILIGDRNQLASVEAGSVLGDICGDTDRHHYSERQQAILGASCGLPASADVAVAGIDDSIALLRKSYRFDEHSGIGNMARAVNSGQTDALWQVIEEGYSDIDYQPLSERNYQRMIQRVAAGYQEYLSALHAGEPVQRALLLFQQHQLLCALREGPYGVTGLNNAIEQQLRSRRLIEAEAQWYIGRPVMIVRNEPSLQLFNGDIGIAAPDDNGQMKVWFEQDEGDPKGVPVSRVPEHQTVYAMTVHKSQGSEFATTYMILPADDSPVLTRELIYTGITRAKQRLELCGRPEVMELGCRRKTERASGLEARLRS
mgnify:CR=1 FL=1